MLWLSDVIHPVIEYTMRIWEFMNGIVHERNEHGEDVHVLHELREKVRLEYAAYEAENFLISRSQSYLFECKTLWQRMNQDRDTLSCWLAEVVDAKDDQKRFRERAAAAARQFFQPKRQGVEVIQDVSDSGLKVCTETYATRECTADISIVGIGFVFVSYSENRVFSRKNEYSYSFFVSEYETNLFHVFLRVTCTSEL